MNPEQKPTLYITMGLPASGKTLFSQQFAAQEHIFFLNVDNLRLAMFEQPTFTPAEGKIVYDAVAFLAQQHLKQGKSIVCNGNYHVRKNRQVMHETARTCAADYRIIWVKTPYEIAAQRIQTRDHEIPVEKMVHAPLALLERMKAASQPPTDDEPTISIDGTATYAVQRASFNEQYAREQRFGGKLKA